MGLLPTIYVIYLTFNVGLALLVGGTWPLPPPDSRTVTVDLLQALGLLVAVSALVFAVSLRVVSRCKDYTEAMDEADKIHSSLEGNGEGDRGAVDDENECDGTAQSLRWRFFSRVGGILAGAVASARHWYLWFWLVYALMHLGLRAHWLFTHAEYPSDEGETTVITVNVLATVSFLIHWGLVVALATERVVDVGRKLKYLSETRLEDAKAALRNHEEC